MLDAWMHSKMLVAYLWTGTAMMFAQTTPVDPALPGWISGITQITGWGVLGWLVYHLHAKTIPKLIADHAETLREERIATATERALDRKETADLLERIITSHTASWDGVRDRMHRVNDSLQVLSAKVELTNELSKADQPQFKGMQ